VDDSRWLRDRIEIDDLLTRYARAVDTCDWELFATVFTPSTTGWPGASGDGSPRSGTGWPR
jgi:hypothetical protein